MGYGGRGGGNHRNNNNSNMMNAQSHPHPPPPQYPIQLPQQFFNPQGYQLSQYEGKPLFQMNSKTNQDSLPTQVSYCIFMMFFLE